MLLLLDLDVLYDIFVHPLIFYFCDFDKIYVAIVEILLYVFRDIGDRSREPFLGLLFAFLFGKHYHKFYIVYAIHFWIWHEDKIRLATLSHHILCIVSFRPFYLS